MTAWSADDLAELDRHDELEIASQRPDGSLRPFVRIWFVRVGDDLYVRSAYGPDNGWYRRARAAGVGRIRVGGEEHDVACEVPAPNVDEALRDAYHAKYDRYGAGNVRTVVSPDAARCTLRLTRR